MKVALGADHRGFGLKEEMQVFLQAKGYEVIDVGARHLDKGDDYPDFAYAVSMLVASHEADRGILVCGSGAGMVIAANKVQGIRAAEAQTVEHITSARHDDDVNVLALGADEITEDMARSIALAFLMTEFSGEQRHERRLHEIEDMETNHGKEEEYE